MKNIVNLRWKDQMTFVTEVNGHTITLDTDENSGGNNNGARPKPFLLVALAGCTAMDVVAILKKMRIVPESFSVDVEGELTENHPKVYHSLHIIYRFKGSDLPSDMLERAVKLSQENYCGVSAMLAKAARLTWEIVKES